MKTCSYRSIVKSSGIYDILIMLPFAIPGVVEWTISLISYLHEFLLVEGSMPQFSPFHYLFINIMAVVSIVWAVIRVVNPIPLYAWYDTAARILIALLMFVYLVQYQVTQVLWVFFIAEITWAALQINGYFFKYRKESLSGAQLA